MINVLFIIPYPLKKAPSQRFRFEQYISFLEKSEVACHFSPFIDEQTWSILYHEGKTLQKFWGTVKGFFKRLFIVFTFHKYDVLFIHREACFIGPAFFETLYAKLFTKKIIYDFDDAIWLHDVSDANSKLGWLKNPSKTAKIIKNASLIFAGNSYLANYAQHFNKNVIVMPTTIDLNYHAAEKKSQQNTIVIGWTGSYTTIKHFEQAIPILAKLKTKYPQIQVHLISNKPSDNNEIAIKFIPWKKENEIEDLSSFDIGIMPLPDDDWAKGKCGFKGLQYMSLSIPTVMSPVGVNTEIITDGINGFLAKNEKEWIEKLSLLIENEQLRKEIGEKGYQTILQKYSVESQKNKYLSAFKSISSFAK